MLDNVFRISIGLFVFLIVYILAFIANLLIENELGKAIICWVAIVLALTLLIITAWMAGDIILSFF